MGLTRRILPDDQVAKKAQKKEEGQLHGGGLLKMGGAHRLSMKKLPVTPVSKEPPPPEVECTGCITCGV